VGDLLAEFGADRFDVVLCTELLEHVQDWKRAIHNLKGVLKPGGLLVLTTRSPGFPKHDYPADYWRFTWGDFGIIFDDLEIEKLQDEVAAAGIFISARKPAKMLKNDLSGYNVYSMDRPAPFFYVVRRGTDSPRIEQAIRSHRTYLSAEALAHRLNQAIGWDCFGVVRGEWTGDNTYTAKWV
jgi:SAM-dependent methyltransferase